MTKGTTISLGLGITALIIAGGLYAYRGGLEKEAAAAPETTNAESGAPAPAGKKMAFYQFAKQGGTYECTVHQLVNNIDTTGTVYMDKGQVRGDWNTSYVGQMMDTHFIVRDNTTYVWSSAMKGTGYKFANDASVQAGNNMSASGSIPPPSYMEQIGDYDCTPWGGDASQFVLPTDINFTEQTTITH
jgi:hypothetical protein